LSDISPNLIAQQMLDQCLRGIPWTLEDAQFVAQHPAMVRVLAEGLSDRFDPLLCDRYAEIFSAVIAPELGTHTADQLRQRHQRMCDTRKYDGNAESVRDIYVLSRVTLGAEIAVTSVVLDGLKRRFPNATLWLAGDRRSFELFETDPRIGYYPCHFERGGFLRRNIANRPFFKQHLVVDPDSRISQLGLVPVCPDENYFFFPSRSYGAQTVDSLPVLTGRWMLETFGAEGRPFIAPRRKTRSDRYIAVSLGSGENPAKRVREPFERLLLAKLAERGVPVVVDRGQIGSEEYERVMKAAQGLPNVEPHRGSFAEFASLITQASLYVGYDSAGMHVAAASGVPLLVFFKGAVNDRFFQRWRPAGSGPVDVIRIDEADPNPEQIIKMLD
jgi:hypothetical protein